MPFFAVQYCYTADLERIAEVRPQHREYLRELEQAGALRASGPLVGVHPGRALLIFEAPRVEDVEAMLSRDPFGREGIVTSAEVTQWDPLIGVFAQG